MTTEKFINIRIDEQPVNAGSGATILQAIESQGKTTPTICLHEATTPEGICRQCVVEVKGWRVLAPACVTKIKEGMEIYTNSERVIRTRRTILEMLNGSKDLSQAPEIITQMKEYQVEPERFTDPGLTSKEVIDDNPFFVRDYDKCIMCWRCVQACGEDIQNTYAISVGGRGYESKISTFFEASMPDTTCVFCGNCVAVCPTNALKSKTEFHLEQGLDYDRIRLEKRRARKAKTD